jgi:glycerol-3-phosphate dehydrogenase
MKGHLVTRSMGLIGFAQATSDTKGGGVMRTIDNNVLVGPMRTNNRCVRIFPPTAKIWTRLCWKTSASYKGFSKADVITYFSGIRASTYEEEFIVSNNRARRQPGAPPRVFIHPVWRPHPRLPNEFPKSAASVLSASREVLPNAKFNPRRNHAPGDGNLHT